MLLWSKTIRETVPRTEVAGGNTEMGTTNVRPLNPGLKPGIEKSAGAQLLLFTIQSHVPRNRRGNRPKNHTSHRHGPPRQPALHDRS
jgi:hypothetical protein